MSKRSKIFLVICVCLLILSTTASFLISGNEKHESIKEVMKDAVLHESNKVDFLWFRVNPSVISAFIVTGILLVLSLVLRIFVIPKFKEKPGRFQVLIEEWVGYFDRLAKTNSKDHHKFLSVYLFCAGTYIFFGTIFELFGIQAISTGGESISLSAPLSDINGALAMGLQSFGFILLGGIIVNKVKGSVNALKEFSLPISMSFRLFGALLSGLLVTELVYFSKFLSYVVPVFVAVLFTLLHAIIQTYVLTMLTSVFFGEVTEEHGKKHKKQKKNNDLLEEKQ